MNDRTIAEMIRFHYEMLDKPDLDAVLSQLHNDVYFKHPPIWSFETDAEYDGIEAVRGYYDRRGRRGNEHTVEKILTDGNEAVAFVLSRNPDDPDFEEHTALVYFRTREGAFDRYQYGSCPGRFRFS